MKLYLTKKNRITVDFVSLETDDKFLRIASGKVGKTGVANSTRNCGTPEQALIEIEQEANQCRGKGYQDTELQEEIIQDIVFDKAKWHFGGDFPKELDHYQGYVHTGLYFTWIVEKALISEELKQEFATQLNAITERKITGAKFYCDYLDGVFSSEELNEQGIKFTAFYFDFEKGSYLKDYELELVKEQPTLYHIADTWDNYERIKKVIEHRFNEWKKTHGITW